VKFLIDNAVSPEVAVRLRAAGHDAVHVRDRGMGDAEDEQVIALAAAEARVIVSADTDFGALLMLRKAQRPSVILFRHGSPRKPAHQVESLLANLPAISEDLTHGAIAVFRHDRIRVRRLS
jgi:predicted nuclease of predicted toxin-antitoxin system